MERGDTRAPAPAPLALDVALAPLLLARDPARMARTVYIVVDVIRATTTLCVLFERGCPRVAVAGSIAAARAAAQRGRDATPPDQPPPLLAGEVGGLAPAGFDHGNSPVEFASLDLRGRTVIFATTNGTRALHACAGGAAVLAGAFRNASAVARATVAQASQLAAPEPPSPAPVLASNAASETLAAAADDGEPDGPGIVIVCAGRDQHPAYDDTLCAGYLALAVERAAAAVGRAITRANGARIAIAAARTMLREGGIRAALGEAGAGRAIAAVGLAADLDWCAEVDACPHVPAVMAAGSDDGLLAVRAWTPG